jgi:hypothetical protein
MLTCTQIRNACGLLALLAAGALAEDTRLAGPVSGIVFDSQDRSLRWIVGVPGAAYLGSAVASGLDIAAVAPNGKYGLGVKDGALFLLRLDVADLQWETLEAEAGTVEQIHWSADSSAAVVSGDSLRIWRNLGGAAERLALSTVDGSKWVAFGIESGAQGVLAATQGAVYHLTASEARLVAAVETPSGLAVATDVAYVTDRAGKQVLALRNWKESAEISLIGTEALGIDDPVAVGLAGDLRSLFIAGGTSRSIVQFDPQTGLIMNRWSVEFEPSCLDRLPSGLFSLTRRAAQSEPLQVLTTGSQPSIFFVPAGAALIEGAGTQEE